MVSMTGRVTLRSDVGGFGVPAPSLVYLSFKRFAGRAWGAGQYRRLGERIQTRPRLGKSRNTEYTGISVRYGVLQDCGRSYGSGRS